MTTTYTVSEGYVHRTDDPDFGGIIIETHECATLITAARDAVRYGDSEYRTEEAFDEAVSDYLNNLADSEATDLLIPYTADLDREFFIRAQRSKRA